MKAWWHGISAASSGLFLAAGLCGGWSAACGATDTAKPSADAGDAHVEGPCDLAKPFGAPVPVKGLATPERSEGAGRFTANERIVYFKQTEPPAAGTTTYTSALFVGIRPTPTEPAAEFTTYKLSEPVPAEGEYFSTPNPAPDGKSFFFDRSNLNTGLRTIWTASTSPPGVEVLDAGPLAGPVNEGESQSQPYVVPNGAMYFVRDDADGLYQVFRATQTSPGYYGAEKKVYGLGPKPKQLDGVPVVTGDERTIYWASDRLGPRDVLHIYVATRPDATSSFSDVRLVLELSTPDHLEAPNYVSPDGCRLYFTSSTRISSALPTFTSDILVATKPR